ncbi:MAG: hypothetical protein K1X78_03305 [Verrucomicrobiaceae bacterium]|nr:hypothetical protein [Verrucomicrobiaceae bacterium]
MHPQTQPPSSQPRFLWRYTAAVLASLMVTDPFLLAAPPAWWTNTAHPERNVTPSTLAAQRDDFSAANIGQLKTLARKAMQAMDDAWPGYGAGPAVHSMAAAWDSPAAAGVSRDDYAAVNAGQLKSVAKPFYDRLIQLGHRPPNAYPWSSSTASRDDYALVNIGQVKSLFSFEIPPQFLPHTDQGVSTHQGLTAVQSMLATYQQMLANLAMLNTLLASWQTMKDNLDALRDLLWALADEAAQLGDDNTLDQIQDVIHDLNGTASAMPRAPGIHLQVQLRHVLDSWGMSSLDGQPIYQHAETRMLESWVRLNGGPIWDRLMPTDGVISYHWPMYVPGEFPPDELPVGPGDQTLVSTWMDVPVSAMSTLAKYVEMPTVSVAGSYVSLSGTVSVQECRVRLHADGLLDSPHTESFLLLSRKGNYSPAAFDQSVMDQISNHALSPSSFYSPTSIFDYGDIPPPDTVTPGTPGGPAVITLTIEKNATTSLPARVPAPQPDAHDPAVPANGAKMMDVALLPVEVKVHQMDGYVSPTGSRRYYNYFPRNEPIASNLFALWPNEEAHVKLRGLDDIIASLPQGTIQWTSTGTTVFEVKTNRKEVRIARATPGEFSVTVTVGSDQHKVYFDVPDVGPNLEEDLPLIIGAEKAWAIRVKSGEIREAVKTRFSDDKVKQDAIKHPTWSAWLCQAYGKAIAITVTNAHEATNKENKSFAFDSTMDLHNNRIGFAEWEVQHVMNPGAIFTIDQWIDKMVPHYSSGDLWIWWEKTPESNDSDGMLRKANNQKIK